MDSLSAKIRDVSLHSQLLNGHEFKSIRGKIILPAWKDFNKARKENDISDDQESPDSITINIGSIITEGIPGITEEHINAYNFLVENQEPVKTAILTSLLSQYSALQEQYDYDAEDSAAIMPDISAADDFKSLIRLSEIHILDTSKEGMSYVGYQFLSTWDEEHGLGFMLHKDRVVETGGADTSFLEWIAERDLDPERVNAEIEASYRLAEEQNREKNRQQEKKPWWKFW